ncbi:hypothetical protein [Microbacterium sp. BH-3-3-3]|uniref:hypothetical protein n=1 Tax=Microbacterium sp. BH-3-3-3 TaxID=1906742 RepID=UPI0011A20173|nr:hypothetical protein [Microbacterium sp. BH-3-3-3]
MTTTSMSIESVGYSAASGAGFTTTLVVRGTGVPAIEKALAAFDKALDADAEIKRKLASARTMLERFDELANAEAIIAGATGGKVDPAEVRSRKVAATQAVEDLELEAASTGSYLTTARSEYMAAVRENLEALRKAARDEAADCSLRLSTALEMTRNASARLDAVVSLFAGSAEIANGMAIPAHVAPKTAADDLNDGGYPNVIASLAADELEHSLGWLSRWITRADEQAAERKAAAKEKAA